MNSRRRQRGYAQPISNNNTQSSHNHNLNCGEPKNEDPSLAPVRSLKRKKSTSSVVNVPGTSRPKGRNSESQRTENRAPALAPKTNQVVSSASRQSSTRVMSAMGRPSSLGSDFPVRVSSKKDKSMIEEPSKTPRNTRQHSNVDETDKQHSGRHFFTGPLAVAEHERMKKEIETLKETVHESRQVCRLQAKQLEESRAEANAAVIAMKDREIELVGAKAKSRKNEELLSIIESSVQCQICMDLPERPFALNPCGHVLCLSCLQEWFRKAPPALDDMDADPDELTDPQYVLMRSKTCPSCRAVVKHRPVPIFMVKSVVSAIKKTKLPHTSSPGGQQNDDYLYDNPWKGIFTSSDEEEEADDDDDGGDDDESQVESDSDDLGGWYRHSHRAHFEAAMEGNATSESEMENEEDEDEDGNEDDDDDDGVLYTQQRWAPPTVSIFDHHVEGEDLVNWGKLLQRGCSWDMLRNFDVSYSHGSGIIVILRSLDHLYASDDDDDDNADDISMYRVFLGWNISLDHDDTDGENYIQEMLREIKDVPERWEVTPTPGMPFAIDARRLVVVDEAGEFETTDTEAWIDNEEDL